MQVLYSNIGDSKDVKVLDELIAKNEYIFKIRKRHRINTWSLDFIKYPNLMHEF